MGAHGVDAGVRGGWGGRLGILLVRNRLRRRGGRGRRFWLRWWWCVLLRWLKVGDVVAWLRKECDGFPYWDAFRTVRGLVTTL